ncbi:uncharacterized protein LOC141812830 isoform X3 [Curcuma longa]|uniref:uncharacterized protein LOC141812830 isoform X3 n=1 Tax=Curcuma longa TaxID=136217 RepID=UPI003D9ED800
MPPPSPRCILESNNFELFFKYVALPTFDIASDALATFKFFELSEKLLAICNKKTILKDSQNSQTMKRYVEEVRYLKIIVRPLKVNKFFSINI